LELLRIQVQRFTFERDAADARQALSAAKIALRTAAGAEHIAEDFEVVGELGFKEVSLDKAVLMRRALDNRPDLRAAEADRARERVVSLRDVYLPKATVARDTVEFAYRRGGQSLLDFLDAQRSYRETALAHLQALGAYLSAVYQLEADIGGPLD